ncbi:MAG: glycosyltransferase [Pseudomonadota bacterium]
MKIAYLNAKYRFPAISGGHVHVAQFVENLLALGHEVWMDAEHRHPRANPLPARDLSARLVDMDVVYVRVTYRLPEICRLVLPLENSKASRPIFVWEFNVHPSFGSVKGLSDSQIEQNIDAFKLYAPGCDLAVCVSDTLRDYVSKALGINHVVTVANASDPELVSPQAKPHASIVSEPDLLNVVWVGSANLDWHNLALVLDTARHMEKAHSDTRIHFHLFGKEFDARQALPSNVTYHGPAPYHDLPQWLAAMDVGLALYHPGPADYNSPMKLFDYMASGLAVIGSEHPQLRQIFSECGQAELLLPSNDPEALADMLNELSDDRDRIARHGRMARELVISKYNWKTVVSTILGEIQSCLTPGETHGLAVRAQRDT